MNDTTATGESPERDLWPPLSAAEAAAADKAITALLRRTLNHAEALVRDAREALGLPSVVEASWQGGAAEERARLLEAAGQLKFRLYRPGNGPGAGTQALDVVPFTELAKLLGDGPAEGHANAAAIGGQP